MEESRRRFLKASGAVVGTSILGASAGCTGILGGGGGGGGPLPGDYPNWLYEPGTITDTDHYYVSARAPIQIDEYEDEFDEDTFDPMEDGFESTYSTLDLDFDEVESVTTFDGNTAAVLTGYEVDREDVEDELEDNDYEDGDEYQGYQLFVGPDEYEAVGVGDGEIVVGRSTTLTGGTGNDVQGNGESGSVQDLREIEYGQSWESVLDDGDPSISWGYYSEPVTFEGEAGDVVTINAESQSGSPYIELNDPDGVFVTDSPTYESNVQITEYELQQTGEYTIRVQSSSTYDGFPYVLTLTLEGTPIDPTSVVETIVDTASGDESRYVDESDAFSELMSQLNNGTFVFGQTQEETEETNEEAGQFEGAVAAGSSYTVNGETMDIQAVIVFDDADDVDVGDVEDWTEDSEDETFDDVDDIAINANGRSAIVTGTLDTDDY